MKFGVIFLIISLNTYAGVSSGGGVIGTGGGGKDSFLQNSCSINPYTKRLDCLDIQAERPYIKEEVKWDFLINDINKNEYIEVDQFKQKYDSLIHSINPRITKEFEYNNCVERQYGEDISDCLKTDVLPHFRLN